MLLYILSTDRFAFFERQRLSLRNMLPLAVSMCLNVVLPNASLQFSSVTFYQIARILLTPTVAAINFMVYKNTIPRSAVFALVPVCLGVGIVSYYDSLPRPGDQVTTTSPKGVVFAFTGVLASSMYTVWIAVYHRQYKLNSMQLLLNQAPVGVLLLLFAIPIADTFPDWGKVAMDKWVLIGLVSAMINYRLWL